MAKIKDMLTNIDDIITAIKKKAKYLTSIEKVDGITIECMVAQSKKAEERFEDIKTLCKSITSYQPALELNEKFQNTFLIQFPDMEPEYTDEFKKQMYFNAFEWLTSSYVANWTCKNKPDIAKHMNTFVKHAILIHYRGFANQYRQKPEDLLDNKEYVKQVEDWFREYIKQI